MKKIVAVFTLLFLSACSTIPEQVRIADDVSLISYDDAKAGVGVNNQMNARWGGVIAAIENKKEFTVIEVVNIDLTSNAKPKNIDESSGRYRLYYKGLLDPVIFKPGKKLTVIGKVAEPETGKIGEQAYLFPVLMASGIHLWKDVERVDVRVEHSSAFTRPYFYPYYRYQPYYRNNTIIVKKEKVKTNRKQSR